MYNTEDGVGQALKTLLESGHKREDIYVTTKVWPESYTYQKVRFLAVLVWLSKTVKMTK